MSAKKDKQPQSAVEGSTWNDSLHINRGKEAESDEIQKFVRHHRKDEEIEDDDSQREEGREVIEEGSKIQKNQAA